MRLVKVLIILLVLTNCSFDNKSGIWENEKSTKKNTLFKDFSLISYSGNTFNKTINLNKNYIFKISKPINNSNWEDFLFSGSNNLDNFKYNNNNQVIYQSKKLSRYTANKFLLMKNNNLIINDEKGNIIIFSINDDKIISKYNFYEKKYKSINKRLNLIIEKNIIYVSDNIGYLYAYNYKIDKVIWAKNYREPFRSNIKILGDKIITSNENNDLIFFNKFNGNIIKKIPTEETNINNNFKNNISSNNLDTIFFLNSYGSLYSVDINRLNINWFLNLSSSNNLSPDNLFSGVEIVNYKDTLVASTNSETYLIDVNSGLIRNKFNFTSLIKPIVNNYFIFFITKNDLLISVDLKDDKILYSYNISDQIADLLKSKKKNLSFLSFRLINNDLKIFLKNSFILDFRVTGRIKNVYKLPKKIISEPIIVDNSILFLDKSNKLIILN